MRHLVVNLCIKLNYFFSPTDAIIEHSSENLSKLDVSESDSQSDNFIEYVKLLELRSMKRLKVLNCFSLHSDEISSIRKQLPHLSVNSENLNIAQPKQQLKCEDGFWEIKSKQVQLFC